MLFPENESQQLEVLLFSKNPNPMWIYNQNNLQFLDVNEAAVAHYGYSREEFLQMRITDICPPENVPIFREYLEKKHTDLHFSGQCLHRRKDGQILDVEVVTHTINYANYNARLVNIRDITEHKRIERKLQEQNEFLRRIFESIPLMIALIDTNGKLQWVNQEWESVLGWKFKDFQAGDVLEALYPNAEYRQDVINFMQSAQHNWADFRTQVRDGDLLDTSWTNVKLSNGQIITIGQDITERKRTELALKSQAEREQLMRTVAQRIRQSLNLQDILNATVQEVRDLLGVDRVVVYQFDSEMIGTIMAESVEPGWRVSLGVEIYDTCFQTGKGAQYYQVNKRAIANIYEAGLTDCHIRLLEQFEVKANLVVPILLEVSSQG
ncbi:PAS domain S-box protein, partial [Nostoc sp. UCD120]|uniref:PAS domain S-box protein n=1 Tax=Nostoc sp. UCD120 TaxID=2681312 RepID=UPI0016278387